MLLNNIEVTLWLSVLYNKNYLFIMKVRQSKNYVVDHNKTC